MGKTKREWESMVEQGESNMGLGLIVSHNRYEKVGSKDVWNLWDNDGAGDNIQGADIDRLMADWDKY